MNYLHTYTTVNTRKLIYENLECHIIYLIIEKKDCDNNGKVTCLDYLKIHLFGKFGCTESVQVYV